ncbi:hypothetical protein, partial [Tenacibaculum piscium]|uniref:hypothetical protein n=1 Tax=Tenacibaculum piscium TaxID=1458515 RepID=UPI001F335806
MIAIIKDVNTRQFKFNGKTYLKNFIAVFYEQGFKIVNVYDSKFSLGRFKYEDVTVDGVTYTDAISLSLVLTPILLQQTGTVKDGDFLDLINSHIENTTVHITAIERQRWNNLQQYFDIKNTLLSTAVANKVDFSRIQNLPTEQQIIAQKNVGLFEHTHDNLYASLTTTYSKTDVDNAILTSMNEVVQILLNNPDAEINSIQELLSEMNTADNALITSIA